MKRKKIAHVVTRLDHEGVPDLFRMIVNSLRDEYDVTIVLGPSAYMTDKTKDFIDGFDGRIVQIPFLRREINPFFDLMAFLHLFFVFLTGRFAVVHTHTAKAGLLGRVAAKCSGVKKIVHMPHGHNFYGYFNRSLTSLIIVAEKMASFCTDKLIVLTELAKQDYLARKIIKAEKIAVIPSGMDIKSFHKFELLDKERKRQEWGFRNTDSCVVLASRLAHVKGSDIGVEIAKRVYEKRKDIVFVFVGSGPMEEELKQKVQENELIDTVRFLGWRDDVLEIIACADLLLQPSRNEAVGRSLLEAQLLGTPVVASRVGGIPEIVHDGHTGLLFKREDVQDAIEAIERLVDDRKYALNLAANAKQWVKENFSAEDMIRKIKDLYL